MKKNAIPYVKPAVVDLSGAGTAYGALCTKTGSLASDGCGPGSTAGLYCLAGMANNPALFCLVGSGRPAL